MSTTNGHERMTAEQRVVMLTPASRIPIKRARWLWAGRVASGTLALLVGREGLGKSTLAYWLAAQVTRGTLPGEYLGEPRSVLVCATEDDWAVTIGPRLLAAGADLELVHRVEVLDLNLGSTELVLPKDLESLEARSRQEGSVLLLLDPLISRLGRANTHKDAEVRQALEPLAALGTAAGLAILGLIHPSKASDRDPVSTVMGSRAFTAVARSVHSVVLDPEADTDTSHPLLFGTVKNNMGPTSLPSLTFRLEEVEVGTDDGHPITGSRVVWGEETSVTIQEAQEIARETMAGPSRVREAMVLVRDLRDQHGGCIPSAEVQRAIKGEQLSDATMRRALKRLGLVYQRVGWGGGGVWLDPDSVTDPTP